MEKFAQKEIDRADVVRDAWWKKHGDRHTLHVVRRSNAHFSCRWPSLLDRWCYSLCLRSVLCPNFKLTITDLWVHAKKVMDHATLRSDLRSQKS